MSETAPAIDPNRPLDEVLARCRELVEDPDYPTVRPNDDLDFAMRLFGRYNVEEIPVVAPDAPQVLSMRPQVGTPGGG